MKSALEIMKTHVVTVSIDSTFGDAVDRMDIYQVNELPVIDAEGRLCGMVTESDIAAIVAEQLEANAPERKDVWQRLCNRPIREAFVSDVPGVNETDVIDSSLAREILLKHRRIAVINDDNRVVGTLNRVDVVQALFEGELANEPAA